MKNQPIASPSIAAAKTPSGLRGLLNQLFGRSQSPQRAPGKIVKVWDSRCDAYRNVDLNDKNDPLWPTACELERFARDNARRSAA
jgi:hypothetical protein